MKRSIRMEGIVIGMLFGMSILRTDARTDVWDQPVTFTLSCVQQSPSNAIVPFALTTRTLIEMMASQTITNPEVTITQETVPTTNLIVDGTVPAFTFTNNSYFDLSTNSYWFTPALVSSGVHLVYPEFPTAITVFLPVFVNGVPTGSNTLTLAQTSTNPPTYTFRNQVGSDGYFFTNAFVGETNSTATNPPAQFITAILQPESNPSNLIFSFEYSTTIIGSTQTLASVTNYSVVTTPDFATNTAPSLHRLVTIVDGIGQGPRLVVRTLRPPLDTEVTGLFTARHDTNTVTRARPRTTTWSRDDVYFISPAGSDLRFTGLRVAVTSPLFTGTNRLTSALLLGSTNYVGAGGVINGMVSPTLQVSNTTILGRGTVIVGPGHIDP